jgi:hypothetical protein
MENNNMKYSFTISDANSFSILSRVYEVYDTREKKQKTAVVIGYDAALEKYFITLLGDGPLSRSYDLTIDDITTTEFTEILYEFFNDILPFMSLEDIIDKTYTLQCASLTKDNFVVYVSDIEPYYMEDTDEYEGIQSTTDHHSNFLMDIDVLIPAFIEDTDNEEYIPYDFNSFIDIYYDNSEIELYCDIDYDLLEKEYNKIHE